MYSNDVILEIILVNVEILSIIFGFVMNYLFSLQIKLAHQSYQFNCLQIQNEISS